MMRFVTRIMIGCRRHDETRRATPILDVPAAGSGNSTSGRLFFLPFKELTEQHFSILGLRKARRAGLVLAQELFEHAPHVGARHSNAFGGRHPNASRSNKPFLSLGMVIATVSPLSLFAASI